MVRHVSVWRLSVGKKVLLALTGVILFGFVIGHMLGNLKIFLGPEEYNHYAHWLREVGAPLLPPGVLLQVARIVLLLSVGVHMILAWELSRQSWAARTVGYRRLEPLTLSYASLTMRWGGVTIALFVIYHLLHFTFGKGVPGYIPQDVYHNVVAGFRVWYASAIYIVAMIPLGLHLYHGVWSLFQTLGLAHPAYNRWRRPVALLVALAVVAGNVAIPVSVLTGLVR